MTHPKKPESVFHTIHQYSGAAHSALYYLVYPNFESFVLVSKTEESKPGERYWRSQCSDKETVKQLKQAQQPYSTKSRALTGAPERTVIVPIALGKYVIGASAHCFADEERGPPEDLMDCVKRYSQDLFEGWIEFLVAEQSRPLPVLLNVASEISSSLDLDQVLLNVVQQATVLFRAKMSTLMLLNKKTDELELATAYGCSLDYLDKENLPLQGTVLGRVVLENRLVQVENIFKEKNYLHKHHAKHEGVASLLSAPIAIQNDVMGVLNIYSTTPRHWQRSECELLQTFAAHAAIAIVNANVHEQNIAMEEQLHVSERLASLGELAAGLAHEIRNPLAVINMLIHSWKSDSLDEENFKTDVDVIAQKISDLNRLVSDLLSLAKTRPLNSKPHDMLELIDRIFRLLRHRIKQQKVKLRKIVKVENTIIVIDRERIEQAILNLLLNALDVTQKGEVVIQLREEGGNIAIDVIDSGPGIPQEQLPFLFKAFHTSKANGMGLGLPMTRRIVEEHKGKICVTRNGTDGATFTMTLPRCRTDF